MGNEKSSLGAAQLDDDLVEDARQNNLSNRSSRPFNLPLSPETQHQAINFKSIGSVAIPTAQSNTALNLSSANSEPEDKIVSKKSKSTKRLSQGSNSKSRSSKSPRSLEKMTLTQIASSKSSLESPSPIEAFQEIDEFPERDAQLQYIPNTIDDDNTQLTKKTGKKVKFEQQIKKDPVTSEIATQIIQNTQIQSINKDNSKRSKKDKVLKEKKHQKEESPLESTSAPSSIKKSKKQKKCDLKSDIDDHNVTDPAKKSESKANNLPKSQTGDCDCEACDDGIFANAEPIDVAWGTIADEIKKMKKPTSAEDFELLAVIGRGSLAKVMQVRCKIDGKVYAMKVMKKETLLVHLQVKHVKDEKSILQRISHPFIVKLHYAFQSADKLYLIMDFVNGGELFSHLRRESKLPIDRVRFYAAEIVLAIKHLHENGVVYRDLKPENILIDKTGHIVITDFGLSSKIDEHDGKLTSIAGTPDYLAPEIITGIGYSFAADWWSFGILVYEMATGRTPFYSKNIRIMYQKVLYSNLDFDPDFDHLLKDLILRLLEKDPSDRLSGAGVMRHPFFESIDWNKLSRKEVCPPWIPKVVDENDLSNIDPVFLQETPNSPEVGGLSNHNAISDILREDNNKIFDGFSYAGSSSSSKNCGLTNPSLSPSIIRL